MSTRENLEREANAASSKLHEAGETIKTQAHEAVDHAKSAAATYAEQGVDVAASSLGDFAAAVRDAADRLNERDQGLAAKFVGQAADGLEQVANSISGASLDDMMGSVQRFARQNPAAFVGVAVLAGIALGRFAKASSERTHGASGDWSSTPGYPSRDEGRYESRRGAYDDDGYRPSETRGTEPNRPGPKSGTASAGRPMAAGTGPASGRATVAPASSTPKK
jgi:hypothetical protein